MKSVTICTPSFNRVHTLNRLYKSLLVQECIDFEWILVDDGSTDSTSEFAEQVKNEGIIDFTYIYQTNGGKHRAVNKAIDIAEGNCFFILDSDDYLTPDAVSIILNYFEGINNDEKIVGVGFNKGYSKDRLIGKTFKGEYIDVSSIERDKYNILGDKLEVFKTRVLKVNKFPEIPNEKFLSEIVLWTRIAAQGYKIRWVNKIIYICEYLEDGLTANNEKLIKENPYGYALRIKEQIKYANISYKKKIGYFSHFYQALRKTKSLSEVASLLDVNPIVIYLSYILRKLVGRS
ncbi:TPA: glycosyltransferase family 2 protein [Streptococcus suis]